MERHRYLNMNGCKLRIGLPVISLSSGIFNCQGASQSASDKSGILCSLEGPLETPLHLVECKRDSSRVEAGTSVFLSISDSDRKVPACWPLDCKKIQPVHSKGDQPWDFFEKNDAKAETPVLWPPHAKS